MTPRDPGARPRALEIDASRAALSPEAARKFEPWLAAAVARQAPLSFTDLRKGVQGLSSRYVERRGDRAAIAEALDGPARRGAFATYYAALHLLTAHGAARAAGLASATARIVDLGAGTGACGIGVALAMRPHTPALHASDRSAWALGEAKATARAFDLAIRTRRATLPAALPRPNPAELWSFGWVLNELDDGARHAALERIAAAVSAGTRVLVLEPLAGRAVPWWDAWVREGASGLRTAEVRWRAERPAWIAAMDRAARLDHSELGARIAWNAA